jgi:predicted lipid-binding transport protein (Tim44 family)
MAKSTLMLMVLIAGLVGCAGESANSTPPATPADNVDVKFNAPDDDEAANSKNEAKQEESAKAESAKPEAAPSKTSQSKSSEAAGPPDKRCPTLATKAKCEIALGCAWHTDKKCVAQ